MHGVGTLVPTMRAEWISGALTATARSDLVAELAQILPGTDTQRAAFLDAADEEIDAYRKLLAPATHEAELRKARFEALAASGHAFAKAMKALDDDSRDLLEQQQLALAGKDAIPNFQLTLDAARWVLLTAQAAEKQVESMKHGVGRPPQDEALDAMVAFLAHVYGRIFGQQPSAAREGCFARAIDATICAAGISSTSIGESRFRTIIKKSAQVVPPPKRGRKAKPNTTKSAKKSEVTAYLPD